MNETRERPVHNHGAEGGPGLECRESLIGDCLRFGSAPGGEVEERVAKALRAAAQALYFDDSSDYGTALWQVLKHLWPEAYKAGEDDDDLGPLLFDGDGEQTDGPEIAAAALLRTPRGEGEAILELETFDVRGMDVEWNYVVHELDIERLATLPRGRHLLFLRPAPTGEPCETVDGTYCKTHDCGPHDDEQCGHGGCPHCGIVAATAPVPVREGEEDALDTAIGRVLDEYDMRDTVSLEAIEALRDEWRAARLRGEGGGG